MKSKLYLLVLLLLLSLTGCDLFSGGGSDSSSPSDESSSDSSTDSSSQTTETVDPPVISPSGGYSSSDQTVTITSADGTEIWYSLDGSDPATGVRLVYTGPITVSSTSLVRAVAAKNSSVSSSTSQQYYIENNEFMMITRDFRSYSETGTGDGYIDGKGHCDFEKAALGQVNGLVSDTLDDSGNIVTADLSSGSITSAESFSQWYSTIAGVNREIPLSCSFSETATGKTFGGTSFFPLDGLGYDNTPGTSPSHNFGFTTFTKLLLYYEGGEVITFSGDDDVWIFLNGQLIIDIGGIHSSITKSFTLNAAAETGLGLEAGKVYELIIFQAVRHTVDSNFTLTIKGKIVTE